MRLLQTLQGDVLDAAAELDRQEGRNPLANDSALAMAAEVNVTAQYQHKVSADVAAALAAIAAGVYDPNADSCY